MRSTLYQGVAVHGLSPPVGGLSPLRGCVDLHMLSLHGQYYQILWLQTLVLVPMSQLGLFGSLKVVVLVPSTEHAIPTIQRARSSCASVGLPNSLDGLLLIMQAAHCAAVRLQGFASWHCLGEHLEPV